MLGKTIANRYKITEESSQDPFTILYKAQDLTENRSVFIATLKERAKQRPLETLLRFKREQEQLSKLSNTNLLKIYSQGEFEGEDYVVEEYFDFFTLARFLTQPQNAGQPLDLDLAVEIIMQIASGLDLVHQNGILHQCIQPDNIIISPDLRSVKLAGFGYNLLTDISRIIEKEEIISTFGYLSPESSGILRKPIDIRSDIYSLGILFYQLATGQLPYQASDISNLIHQHIATEPVVPSKINLKVPPVLDNIILRLIAKEPQERYQSLTGLIFDLMQYQGQRASGVELVDFEIARTDRLAQISFSTKLIGRDKEIKALNTLLGTAKHGEGGICFIFGEPGIGKSRLVDELRGKVHSLNGLFCGGKCYQYEFRAPYKVFSEAIDAYIEKVKRLSTQEQQLYVKRIKDSLGELGGEVQKIAPAITDLIGTPPALVELEPEKEKVRFLIAITTFLASLATPDNPLLMFLDDLQWADEGSLEILQRFSEKLHESSILLIVSYRDTEVDSSHPLALLIKKLKDQNLGLEEMPVKAFSLEDTGQMVGQILMEKSDEVSLLSESLYERAKGNPFFTLELLHTLVDTNIVYLKGEHYVCDINKLKNAALPSSIVDAVLKRVEDLFGSSLQVLSYASVMGKEIDFEMLIELTRSPFEQVLNSIEDGIRNQLLYRDLTGRENIFFMHDRIREAFYQRIPEEERAPLHQHIGRILEEQNKNDPDAALYDLAYHFTQGKMEDKALQYSMKAGHKAKESYANVLASSLYNTAKEILEKQDKKGSPEYIEILENLGELFRLTGKFDESIASLKLCESLIPADDVQRKAQILSKMGDTLLDKGELENSAFVIEKALGLLKVRVPTTQIGVFSGIGKELVIQLTHMWFPKLLVQEEYKGTPRDMVLLRLVDRLAHVYYFLDSYKMVYLFLRFRNFAERIGPCSPLAHWYINGAVVWPAMLWFSQAYIDGDKGIKMAQKLGDKIREGCGYTYFSLCEYFNNRPNESIQYAQRGINSLKALGEYWEVGIAFDFRDHSNLISGRIKEAVRDTEEYLKLAREVNSWQTLGWALFDDAMARAFSGDIDETIINNAKESYVLMKKVHDKPDTIMALHVLAYLYSRKKDHISAIAKIEEAAKLFPSHHNSCNWIVDFFTIGAHVYLEAVADNPELPNDKRKHYLKRASWFCQQSFIWALQYKFFYGWHLQVNATYFWLTGRKNKAIKTWDKALHFLRTNKNNPGGDKYRIAYILLEEAKLLLTDNPQDKKALTNLLEAKELFAGMGCKLDLNTCNELLSKIMPQGEAMEGREALTQRRHLESLLSTTRAIGSVFVLDELLNKIMDYAIQVTGAERGFLLLYDDKTGQLNLKLSHGTSALDSFSFESHKISLELIRESEKAKDTLIASSDAAPSPKIASELKSYNVKQALSAYLTSRDKPIGILYLDNQLAGGTFGKQELELMQSFAVQASVSLENARLVSDLLDQARLRQEMELGREIQMDLLPKVTPTIDGLKVTGIMLPAKEIGGDYYDFLPNPSLDQLSIVIGDVSGKGVAAGLLMAMVKTCLYALNKQPISPRDILLATNQMLYEHINAKKFMTMLYLTWNAKERKLSYSSAGHEHILIYRSNVMGGVAPEGTSPGSHPNVEAILSGGFMLGMVPEIDKFLEDKTLDLKPGDKVILYTDGVTEARNPSEELFSLQRLTDILSKEGHKPTNELLDAVRQGVYSFIGTREQYDDITLVVMEAI